MTPSPHPFAALIAETLAATAAGDGTALLCIGELPWPAAAPRPQCIDSRTALADATQRPRADLAFARLDAGDPPARARQLVAAMRDLLARRMLVFVPENLLDDTTLRGLGLTLQARLEADAASWQAWSYDIRTYKPVPDWLNPRFWANPENWDKYRW
jgi:hypothetical protein